MAERPILFSAPMVRALLAGTKTQTRRAVKPQPGGGAQGCYRRPYGRFIWTCQPRANNGPGAGVGISPTFACPYGQPGDRLWVREAWRADAAQDKLPPRDCAPNWPLWFEADGLAIRVDRISNPAAGKLRPGMFMPRWASRITLEVTGVRVERLQDISEADAVAEGVTNSLHLPGGRFANENYARLWDTINGEGAWDANPWVWCVDFKRVEATHG